VDAARRADHWRLKASKRSRYRALAAEIMGERLRAIEASHNKAAGRFVVPQKRKAN
jgi:hypothetical protein